MAGVPITRNVGRPTLVQQSLAEWLQDIGNWARGWQIKNGRHTSASDSSINQYEVIIKKDNIALLAADYINFALQGRNAGKRPPIPAIMEWIERKPINVSGEDSALSIAFAIATKIEKEGTDQPRLKPQNIDLVIDNFGKKHLATIGDRLAEKIADEISLKLTGK